MQVCANETISKQKVDTDLLVPPGSWCQLREVELSASILAAGGISLESCKVAGGIEASELGPHESVEIMDTVVMGLIKVSGGAAGAGPLLITEGIVDSVEAQGVDHVQMSDCKLKGVLLEDVHSGIGLEKTSVQTSIKVNFSAGDIDFLDVVVEGLVEVKGCSNCTIRADASSKLNKGLHIQDSSGSISMVDTSMPKADLVVSSFDGSLQLDDVKLGAVDASGVTGGVLLHKVVSEMGASFANCSGTLSVDECIFADFFMSTSEFANATLKANSFNDAEVTIVGVGGPVLLESNYDLDLILEHNNHGLSLVGNDVINAVVSENNGSMTVTNNKFKELACEGNAAPLLTLTDNVVAERASGQCAAEGGR